MEINIQKVLCPVDFSEASEHALRYALAFAQAYDAELQMLHVVEVPFLPSYATAGIPDLSLPVEHADGASTTAAWRVPAPADAGVG